MIDRSPLVTIGPRSAPPASDIPAAVPPR
ncbi:hypothetical protein GRX01_08225 [Halobaculum sp. WSA2]|uniref:Uncharacterized protein n=1 Tax=Halobaculum saliterrae TaxID=2073113 RepID=A0A6B0SXG0_9EURY|nr:hypothetical protein [Halobaculum saliterrae]